MTHAFTVTIPGDSGTAKEVADRLKYVLSHSSWTMGATVTINRPVNVDEETGRAMGGKLTDTAWNIDAD